MRYIWCNKCKCYHPLIGRGWDCIYQYNNWGCGLDLGKIKEEEEKETKKCDSCKKPTKVSKKVKVLGKEMEVCEECYKRITGEIWERQHV